MRLEGKAGVITGAASGLGREVLRLFAGEGAKVIAFDKNAQDGEQAVGEVVAEGGTAIFEQGDVTREDDIAAAIERCRSEFGVFNIIHNNAGIQIEARLHETTTEQWDAVNDVNLKGVFWGCKHAVVAMREGGGGSIVNTASLLALTGDPFLPAYTATKTGVLGLTRAVAVDYAGDNIRCNCVCPGDMDTPMIQKYFDATPDPAEARVKMENAYPGKRIAHPREVAMAVLFLASDESSFINGSYIVADGGLTASVY
jgi:NAD(P)-dependent dehydrogenase (short-subunit alcohol dehydrogenase family)